MLLLGLFFQLGTETNLVGHNVAVAVVTNLDTTINQDFSSFGDVLGHGSAQFAEHSDREECRFALCATHTQTERRASDFPILESLAFGFLVRIAC